jgi:hypothetical protein
MKNIITINTYTITSKAAWSVVGVCACDFKHRHLADKYGKAFVKRSV